MGYNAFPYQWAGSAMRGHGLRAQYSGQMQANIRTGGKVGCQIGH